MSTGATTLNADARPSFLSRVGDYVELTKPRITILELVAVVAAMWLAVRTTGSGLWTAGVVASTLIGTTLLAASANALNMYLERRLDRLMSRTADRPLPTGRLAPVQAATFGVATLSIGFTTLAIGANWLTALMGLASWFLYVAIYTPMKTRSTFNTTVGAVSGALPILIGWTAGGGAFDLTAAGLFGVLMLWQYPHFMAIAWLCREDYASAGYKMSTVVDPSGLRAGAIAVVGAAALLPVGLLPGVAAVGAAGWYAAAALLLAVGLTVASIAFLVSRTDNSARRLLRASLLYLPLWLLATWLLLP